MLGGALLLPYPLKTAMSKIEKKQKNINTSSDKISTCTYFQPSIYFPVPLNKSLFQNLDQASNRCEAFFRSAPSLSGCEYLCWSAAVATTGLNKARSPSWIASVSIRTKLGGQPFICRYVDWIEINTVLTVATISASPCLLHSPAFVESHPARHNRRQGELRRGHRREGYFNVSG